MKYILIISPFIATFLVILVLLSVFRMQPPTKRGLPGFSSTPTPMILEEAGLRKIPLSLTSSSPQDRTAGISTSTTISFVFNRTPFKDEITFSSLPATSFSTSFKDKSVTLSPSTPLLPGTTYYFFIQPSSSLDATTIAFTTASTQGQIAPSITGTYFGSGNDNTPQIMDQLALKEAPDIYLYNRCPYRGDGFSISSSFTNEGGSHYYFKTIVTGDTNASKNNFLQWLLSLGFTTIQIKNLDIRYQ